MKPQIDRILEGVRPAELIQLQALAEGKSGFGAGSLQPLEDKGWVETVAGTPLITLTGRTLLDGVSRPGQ
ncbi:hypothetical protein SAMN05216456_0175 [Devosia crocina]|uniref:Uncharacterized protein n=1 Tax=Devosia crocina TaxID=429728 RepID=A0A1I7MXA2_9HYPH|nr:hypothetical protein [Devosia crocina]SFV27010.1 hypothetical protein SAMN05216456_0175 [Devosia crocina]